MLSGGKGDLTTTSRIDRFLTSHRPILTSAQTGVPLERARFPIAIRKECVRLPHTHEKGGPGPPSRLTPAIHPAGNAHA